LWDEKTKETKVKEVSKFVSAVGIYGGCGCFGGGGGIGGGVRGGVDGGEVSYVTI
jgi:hypothetical protein